MRLLGIYAHDLPSGFRYGHHRHTHWEVIAILGGHGRVVQGQRSHRFKDGDIICNPPGQSHASYVDVGCRHVVLSGMGPLAEGAAVLAADADLQRDLATLDAEYRGQRPLRAALLDQVAGTILLRVQRALIDDGHGIHDGPAAQIKALIDRDFAQPLNLALLASAVGLSRDRTRHCFRAAYGISPNRYLAQVRLGRARDLLQAGEVSVATVAKRCGFSDANYFSRCFSRYFGHPPSSVG